MRRLLLVALGFAASSPGVAGPSKPPTEYSLISRPGTISFTPRGLISLDCALVQSEYLAFARVRRAYEPGYIGPTAAPPCTLVTTQIGKRTVTHYRLSTDSVLTDDMRALHGKRPECNGPNCFNAALVSRGIVSAYRYMAPSEFSSWLHAMCSKRTQWDRPQAGDIGVINDKKGSAAHGFVYISENYAYSKNGFKNRSAYEVQGLLSVLKIYGVPAGCSRPIGANEARPCGDKLEYWNCPSLETHLDRNPALRAKYGCVLQKFGVAERELSPLNRVPAVKSCPPLSELRRELGAIAEKDGLGHALDKQADSLQEQIELLPPKAHREPAQAPRR